MTKKFWADWKNRVGETIGVYVNYGINENVKFKNLFNPINSEIRKIKFKDDYVTIEWNEMYRNFYGHLISKYDCKTLHRIQIKTIFFKKH